MGDSEVHWQFPSIVSKPSGKKSLNQLLVQIYAFSMSIHEYRQIH